MRRIVIAVDNPPDEGESKIVERQNGPIGGVRVTFGDDVGEGAPG